ncbi:UNVERIFIED_CONTAM: ATP synthase subunit O, mitochondrial [Sesamum radiatum]|uniref:ATP synthase subunit O, mitochondrial n=1 Tax=Sesamum radiatum TaxID=300843 RepID=A0AAW2L594_SESRA
MAMAGRLRSGIPLLRRGLAAETVSSSAAERSVATRAVLCPSFTNTEFMRNYATAKEQKVKVIFLVTYMFMVLASENCTINVVKSIAGEINYSRQDECVHEPAFPISNSSFFLRSGLALEAKVVRLRDEMYLIDAGVGRPRIATQEELIKPTETAGPARLTNRVGFLNPSNRESPVKNLVLQRCFVDLVTGDSRIKQQAATRFDDMVGQTEAGGGGEQPLLLPRRFRKHRAWMELKNKWRPTRR